MSELVLKLVVDQIIQNLDECGFRTSQEIEIKPSETDGFCCAFYDIGGEQLEIWLDHWRHTERREFYYGYWSNKRSLMEKRFEQTLKGAHVVLIEDGDEENFKADQTRLKKEKAEVTAYSMMAYRSKEHYWFGRYTPEKCVVADAVEFFSKILQQIKPIPILEGTCNQITVNRRERSAGARRRCLQYYKSFSCQICGFDFSKTYGPNIGSEFIHVHHLNMLAEGEAAIQPERDLIPVCPNCHAMLHRRLPPYTPAEMRKIISNQKSQPEL